MKIAAGGGDTTEKVFVGTRARSERGQNASFIPKTKIQSQRQHRPIPHSFKGDTTIV